MLFVQGACRYWQRRYHSEQVTFFIDAKNCCVYEDRSVIVCERTMESYLSYINIYFFLYVYLEQGKRLRSFLINFQNKLFEKGLVIHNNEYSYTSQFHHLLLAHWLHLWYKIVLVHNDIVLYLSYILEKSLYSFIILQKNLHEMDNGVCPYRSCWIRYLRLPLQITMSNTYRENTLQYKIILI